MNKASMKTISYREEKLNMNSIYEPTKILNNNSYRYYKDIINYLKKFPRNTIRTIEVLPSIAGGCYIDSRGCKDLLAVSFLSCTPESDFNEYRGETTDIYQLFKDKMSFSFADYEESHNYSNYKKFAIAWGKFKGMEHFNDSRRGYNMDYINKFKDKF